MTPKKSEPKRTNDFWAEILFTWLFGEVVFVVLPLLVIVMIRGFMNVPIRDIFLLPEWSFASIVLFASCLDRFVKLKAEGQRDTSVRMYIGIRAVTLLMIFAVLILALAVAHQHGLAINEVLLKSTQIMFFVGACSLLLFSIYVNVDLAWVENNLPFGVGRGIVRRAAAKSLHEAEVRMRYVKRAIDRWDKLQKEKEAGEGDSKTQTLFDSELSASIHRIRELTDEIETTVRRP